MKIAAIDIGSNALRLLIKDTSGINLLQNLDKLNATDYYERIPLKSGMDVFAEGRILPKTEFKLTIALCHFAEVMKAYGVKDYRACATASYRDAQNGKEVMERANKASGLNVEIIAGEEEARVTRLSFCAPQEWADDYFVFSDVGGGSTEVSVLHQGKLLYGHSFQIGSMRYVCNTQDVSVEQALDSKIAEIKSAYPNIHYMGIGGCVKFMNKYLNSKEGSVSKPGVINVDEMQKVYEDLATKTVDEIVASYELPKERADILTPASTIFLRIAHGLSVSEINVPQIGVRNGIITELYYKNTQEI